jgi:hypothetical protein
MLCDPEIDHQANLHDPQIEGSDIPVVCLRKPIFGVSFCLMSGWGERRVSSRAS